MEIDEYLEKYKDIFREDYEFSKAFTPELHKLIISSVAKIYDYERHENPRDLEFDKKGYDAKLTIPGNPFWGKRVRRLDKVKFQDFTIDRKEWSVSKAKYYIYAYASEQPKKIYFYMIFDFAKLKKLAKEGKIKLKLEKNDKHSNVYFWAIKIHDIFRNGLVIDYGGEIEFVKNIVPPEFWGQPALDKFIFETRKGGSFES